MEWTFDLLEDQASTNGYKLKNLVDGSEQLFHAHRLHVFLPGQMTNDQLRAEACHPGEYIIEKVHAHYVADDGELLFQVKWLGYPDLGKNSDDSWTSYPNCRYSPLIQSYIKKNKLSRVVERRNKCLGLPKIKPVTVPQDI